MTLVSICIPTYNGARYLEASIQSALNQSYRDLEILIVDDCSKDETVDVAKRFAARDKRVRFVQNKRNLGLVGNWNRCIELATGAWIKFLFQDDLLQAECVQLMLDEAERQSALFVACDREFLFEASTDDSLRAIYARNRSVINAFLGPNRGASPEAYAQRILRRINNNYVGEPTSTLIHRDVFQQLGLFDSECIQLCDLEFWSRAASHYGIAFVPQALTTFRVHSSATSAVNRTAHSFRSVGLEGLILIDAYLEKEVYAHLRELWTTLGSLARVLIERHHRANEVWEYVRHARKSSTEGRVIRGEYEVFLARHPRCRVSRSDHLKWLARSLPLRYKFRLGQALNPLLPRAFKREGSRPL
ncbi:glycosyltransferase [Niveibacterium sp. 24ML]|uniref:glycosyltransferase family 2 protein n=1 Tax=Niveibacterium sp. 24ML TaxID=2985512 RepID=UPI00226D43CD|nr:glycosyltransferase family 2 protein [Niveibacterium sp. 24ML]MCX9156867.1 glycosyltransferase [Niveibacterium sp. 24ML]